MPRRQTLPRLWLMTDERQGDRLWIALERLPRGSGVVFRHYSLAQGERRHLLERILRMARRRRLSVVVAGEVPVFERHGIAGRHNAQVGRRPGLRTASAHSVRELRAAERKQADLVFVSPAFPTRSHPGARALGSLRFRLIARQSKLPVIALGGMDERRARRLVGSIFGWAAIDAWSA